MIALEQATATPPTAETAAEEGDVGATTEVVRAPHHRGPTIQQQQQQASPEQ